MARKKKSVTDATEVKEDVSANAASSISYSGNVTIKLIKGNKQIKSFQRHNTGYIPLFSFLTNCLTNNFNGNECPKYIGCFISEDSVLSPASFTDETNALQGGGVMSYVSADSEITSDDTQSYKTVYKFIIPATMIDTSKVTSTNKINSLALYNTSNKDSLTSPSAYLSIPTDKQIGSDDLGAGVSIIILWELSFSNSSIV